MTSALKADVSAEGSSPAVEGSHGSARLRAMVDAYFDFAWRSLRRLGVHPSEIDDAAQQLFLVIGDKLDVIEPHHERSFVFGTAVRIAAQYRRRARVAHARETDDEMAALVDPRPGADELVDRKRNREVLDQLLDRLPMELRSLIVLVHGEGMTMAEAASLLGIPPGTVASRLRRARVALEDAVESLQQGSRGAAKRGTHVASD